MTPRLCRLVLICLFLGAVGGCAMLHELQPHRLRRLNRMSPPHIDPEFTQTVPSKSPFKVNADREFLVTTVRAQSL